MLYFYRDEEEGEAIYTGEEAVGEYILNGADGRYMQSIKTFLPDATFSSTTINRKSYTIDALVALILKEYAGYPYVDIARILRISEGNVKIRVFRARQHLSKILQKGDLHVP